MGRHRLSRVEPDAERVDYQLEPAVVKRVADTDVVEDAHGYGDALRTRLGLPIVDMSAEQSKFFKHHYMSQFKNKGIMVRE